MVSWFKGLIAIIACKQKKFPLPDSFLTERQIFLPLSNLIIYVFYGLYVLLFFQQFNDSMIPVQ